jgi:hypothetical protein
LTSKRPETKRKKWNFVVVVVAVVVVVGKYKDVQLTVAQRSLS